MPSLSTVIQRFSQQTIVVWPFVNSDQYGKPAYGDPYEIQVRWEDKQVEMVAPDGRKVLSKAYILTANAIPVRSLVYLGTLSQLQSLPNYNATPAPAVPTLNQGGREVIRSQAIVQLNGLTIGYEVYL